LAICAVFGAPLLVMAVVSLRDPASGGAGWAAYRSAFREVPLARGLLNSVAVALFAVPVCVLCASWAGLAIATAHGRVRSALVAGTVLLTMVPLTLVWISRFVVFKAVGVTGTWIPLLAPALLGGTPLFVLLYADAFRRVPSELFEAARMEGAIWLRVWWRVALPLVRPTTAAVALLSFGVFWSNFLDPLLYLHREEDLTAPVMLHALELLGTPQWPVLLAGAVAISLPPALAFVFAQRAFFAAERGAGWLGR
jgi:multiple sugar transport system permease protein